ncbi:MAG: PKHD-type hydroxylase, partial [Gammaproteobacteria bacterium]
YDLDRAIQRLAGTGNDNTAVGPATELAGVYHNLLRLWAEL